MKPKPDDTGCYDRYGELTETEISQVRRRAEEGEPDVQFRVAHWYFLGVGNCIAQDISEAMRWYYQAADQGHLQAQYQLGKIYLSGSSVITKDIAQGIEWYRKAAKQGYADAAYALGNIYYWGKDVQKDLAEAIKWYQLAAKNGDLHSQYRLKEVTKENEEFLRLIESAESGDPEAQHALGVIYSRWAGEYRNERELEIASTWFHKSASKGFPSAQYALGLMYEAGIGGNPKDLDKAKALYEKAASNGYSLAEQRLCLLSDDCDPVENNQVITVEVRQHGPEGGGSGAAGLACLIPYMFWLCL